MTSKQFRQGRTLLATGYVAERSGYWGQSEALRNMPRGPIGRWRAAVAAVFEPLVLVIIPLLLWGIIAGAAIPLIVAIGLSVALVILVGATLLASILAHDLGKWWPGDAR